jgi:two-component sensor histidine kinase
LSLTREIYSENGSRKADDGPLEEQVLVLAPVGRDGPLTAAALRERGMCVTLCEDIPELCDRGRAGAGVIVLTSDVLNAESLRLLGCVLDEQPPWSDLPIIILSDGAGPREHEHSFFPSRSVTVLERPLRLHILLTAAETALLSRRRQYEVRDLLIQTEKARSEAERQRAEIEALNDRLRRSMRETHHRVKNNLQIIAAMIDMQVMEEREAVPTEQLKRLGMHVRTLASVHDMLTLQAKDDNQAHHVSAQAVLRNLMPLIAATAGDRKVGFTIDDAWLTARQSASLAIVINELVSNALKHGEGPIHVRLCVEGTLLRLEVQDHGPGFPEGFDAAAVANTGLELIEHLSQWDLRGDVRYDNCPGGGGCVVVTVPLDDCCDLHPPGQRGAAG